MALSRERERERESRRVSLNPKRIPTIIELAGIRALAFLVSGKRALPKPIFKLGDRQCLWAFRSLSALTKINKPVMDFEVINSPLILFADQKNRREIDWLLSSGDRFSRFERVLRKNFSFSQLNVQTSN